MKMDERYKWYIAFRPWSYTAAIIPVTVGTLWAAYQGYFNLGLFLLTLVGGVLVQAGTNLINTYYDFMNKVDTPDWINSTPVLVNGWIKPRPILLAGYLCFGLTLAIGFYLVSVCGAGLLYVGLFGVIAGYNYTAGLAYKYKGLGSVLVFFLMGPMMVWAAFYVQTGFHSWSTVWVALPIGFLVSAILHANDLRDLEHDCSVGIKTGAMVTGGPKGLRLCSLLNILPFLCVGLLVVIHLLPFWTLITILLALPTTVSLTKQIKDGLRGNWNSIATLEQRQAQFHFQFGTLMSLGIMFSIYF